MNSTSHQHYFFWAVNYSAEFETIFGTFRKIRAIFGNNYILHTIFVTRKYPHIGLLVIVSSLHELGSNNQRVSEEGIGEEDMDRWPGI